MNRATSYVRAHTVQYQASKTRTYICTFLLTTSSL